MDDGSSILRESCERSFQTCVPGQRLVPEPARIKFWRGEERPGLARMFPVQNLEAQTGLRGGAFDGRRPVIDALRVNPTRVCEILLANQKSGNQRAGWHQRATAVSHA